VCVARVGRWRGECLRGLVGGWLEVVGEEERWVGSGEGSEGEKMVEVLGQARGALRCAWTCWLGL